jgi:hypothetical protein
MPALLWQTISAVAGPVGPAAVFVLLCPVIGIARAAEISLQVTATVDSCPGKSEITVIRGTDVTYCYAVGNPDAIATLTDVRVTDDQFGGQPVLVVPDLSPGDTRTLQHIKVFLSHDTISFVTARATPVIDGVAQPEVSATDSVEVDVQ